MNLLLVLIIFFIGMLSAFAIPVAVTNYFVKDITLAIKIVAANFLVMLIINRVFSCKEMN